MSESYKAYEAKKETTIVDHLMRNGASCTSKDRMQVDQMYLIGSYMITTGRGQSGEIVPVSVSQVQGTTLDDMRIVQEHNRGMTIKDIVNGDGRVLYIPRENSRPYGANVDMPL